MYSIEELITHLGAAIDGLQAHVNTLLGHSAVQEDPTLTTVANSIQAIANKLSDVHSEGVKAAQPPDAVGQPGDDNTDETVVDDNPGVEPDQVGPTEVQH